MLPLPNRLSAGVPATNGRYGAIWAHARGAGACVRAYAFIATIATSVRFFALSFFMMRRM
jgi:hypothetical protein